MTDIHYIGTTPLGRIQGWDDEKTSGITPISFPGQDSGKTEGVDTLGIIAYFNIPGRWTGKFQLIQSYIASLKAIADGNQTSSQEFKSPFVNGNTYSGLTKVARIGNIGTTTSVGASSLSDTTVSFTNLGIQVGDKVKNLITGDVANVTAVAATTLSLDSNIFSSSTTPYAVTATINIKVLSIKVRWEVPGLSYCNYDLSVMQVR